MAVEPKTKADQEKMGIALGRLAQEDPSFRVRTDEESGQTIISGMGELHLEILVDRMKREFNVEANVGKPQVAYRETIRKTVKQEGKFVRQSGGTGQYGHVVIERGAAGRRRRKAASCSRTTIVGGVDPEGIHPGRRARASRKPSTNGVLAGFPIVGRQGQRCRRLVPRRRLRRKWRSRSPARWRSRKRFQQGQPGAARADHEGRGRDARGLHGRRDGRLSVAVAACCRARTTRRRARSSTPMVPLGEMFGYATALRSMSQGRATFTMEFDHYAEAPTQHRRSRDQEVLS